MLLIKRRLGRMIRSELGVFISLILISMLGLSLLILMSSSYLSLKTSISSFLTTCHYPDVVVVGGGTTEDVADLEAYSETASVQDQAICDTLISLPGYSEITLRLYSKTGDDGLIIADDADVSVPEDTLALTLDPFFAEKHHLSCGDTLTLTWQETEIPAVVTRLAYAPEAQLEERNSYTLLDRNTFYCAYANTSDMDRLFQLQGYRSQFQIELKDDANASVLADAIEADHEDWQVYQGDNRPVVRVINNQVNPFNMLSLVFPALFTVVMLLFIFLFCTNIMEKRSREIAICESMGFSKGDVTLLFCSFFLTVTLLASLLGIVIGVAASHWMNRLYREILFLPYLHFSLDSTRCLLGIVFTNVIGQLAVHISMGQFKRRPLTALLKGESTEGTKPPFLLRHLPAQCPWTLRLSLGSILRNKLRFLVGFTSVLGSVMLLFIVISINLSKTEMINFLFEERFHYTMLVELAEDAPSKTLETMAGDDAVAKSAEATVVNTTISCGENTVFTAIEGIPGDTDLVCIYTAEGELIDVPDQGIILAEATAEVLGCKVGDWVQICDQDVQVKALAREDINLVQYCSKAQGEALSVHNRLLFCDLKGDADLTAFNHSIKDLDGFRYSLVTQSQRESAVYQFRVFDIGALLLIGFTLCMAMVTFYNLGISIWLKRRHEFLVLQTMGCLNREISAIVLWEQLLQLLLGSILGLPLGQWIGWKLLIYISNQDIIFPLPTQAEVAPQTMAIIITLCLLSHALINGYIRRAPLVENSID